VPTRRGAEVEAPSAAVQSGARPVLLATLDVPFDPEATRFGVDAAVEAGAALLVVNVVETAFVSVTPAGLYYVVREDVEDSLRRPCALALSLGVEVERLRVRSPRPVEALLEVVGEREPGLIVFGPDRTCVSRRRYRKAARALSERAPCLLWIAT
jgi:nucleotide-binding universal stress UspA family protein